MTIAGKEFSPRRVYYTYFDSRYLLRGAALVNSLSRSDSTANIFVVALDEIVERFFVDFRIPNVSVIPLSDIEAADRELTFIKSSRSLIEYYFTLTSVIGNILMNSIIDDGDKWICYVDADLFFYADVGSLFESHPDAHVLITPHDFPRHLERLRIYGDFNVGFIAWRNSMVGRLCLSDYRRNCLEWCFDRVEGDRFADQKYLNTWCDEYSGVVSLRGCPINISYWNIGSYSVTNSGEKIFLDNKPLIAWHYSGLVTDDHITYQLTHCSEEILSRPIVVSELYKGYISHLNSLYGLASKSVGFPKDISRPRLR